MLKEWNDLFYLSNTIIYICLLLMIYL